MLMIPVFTAVPSVSVGGKKIQGGCPIEDPLFTKILPDFRPIFCPIMADFCKFFQRWEGCSPPRPPVSYAYGSKDVPQLNREINEDLEKLDKWLMGNKLSLKLAKTHSMLIVSQQKHKSLAHSDIRFDPKIRETDIEIRSKAKYLGVQIDDNLNWKEHIRAVSTKVSRAVGFLKYSKQYLPLTAVMTLYTSIVEPHFQYCCSVWGCCNTAEIQHLQKLQNRVARIITNSSFDAAIKPMFESLGMETIQQLIDTQSKIVTFKSLAQPLQHKY